MTEDEQNQYLWDRTGPPDPEVARLEELLRPLGFPDTASSKGLRVEHGLPRLRRLGTGRRLVAAAAALILGFSAWFLSGGLGGGWKVRHVAGQPAVDGVSVDGEALLPRGGELVTGEGSRARIDIGRIGRVDVDPGSRVSLVTAGAREHRLSLDRGTIHARIWAPPRFFYVNTPFAEAIDLGCAFTLKVDETGGGLLRVTHGWVQLAYGGREAYIPQGAVGETRPGVGPGTPRYEDAPPGYAAALEHLDFGDGGELTRAGALQLILDTARRRDAITLWHLLSRSSSAERPRVYERLAHLAPPPPRASRDAVLAGDRKALDAWWDSLEVEGTSFWSRLKNRF
jgi:ferric-dicitrate binding protein FerR (iron transport regulator)